MLLAARFMSIIDISILGVLLLSAVWSFFRGFVREFLSLLTLMLASWVALTFYGKFAVVLQPYVASDPLRTAAAVATLFVATLLLGAAVNALIGRLIKKSGLGPTNRILGLFFGLMRGGLIICVLVLLAGITPAPSSSWWHESRMLGYFQAAAVWFKHYLPPQIAEYINYS